MKSKKQIYIIDDVNENLQVLGNILKQNGYNISVARNGEQALIGIPKKQPDLVLLDISMPGMDGFEVCERLKSDSTISEIPIIFLTARTETEDIVKGFKTGGVDYITKPFNADELLVRVKTHLELKEAREELVNLNATKDKFFRIIAHDLKSPLASLFSFTELFQSNINSYSKEEIKEYLNVLNRNTELTSKLLENLLTWARSQSGKIQFEPENFSVKELVMENISLLKSVAQEKQLHLYSEDIEDLTIYADRNMITTVLRNLISNAIKFTPHNGKVSVRVETKETKLIMSVIDTGLGVKQEDINKLFKIDQHHTTLGTNKEKGTGLGLILCKEFVNRHNGEIWVESELEKGSAFKFTLPINAN